MNHRREWAAMDARAAHRYAQESRSAYQDLGNTKLARGWLALACECIENSWRLRFAADAENNQ